MASQKNSFAKGALVGAVIGAVLGVLYAPQEGKKTRKLLKQKADDLQEKALETKLETQIKLAHLENTLDDFKARIAPILDELEIKYGSKGIAIKNKILDTLQELRLSAEPSVKKGRRLVKKAKTTVFRQ